MTTAAPLILYGVFRQLVHNHVPLGVADYLDALRALEWQLGRPNAPAFTRRDDLRRLCQVLWARNPDEIRLIDRIFEGIPLPSTEEEALVGDALEKIAPSSDRRRDPRSSGAPVSAGRQGAHARRASDLTDAQTGTPEIAVSFAPLGSAGTVALPYPVLPPSSDTFVMQPQTVMSPRALAVLWRRYRRMVRTGPRLELDLDATAAERVRRGVMDRPVLRPRRANAARLLILADVSPSMSAWGPFLDTLATSVALSRLQSARLLYFTNVPRQSFFTSPALTTAVPARKVFDQHGNSGLLVVSDAGAARGFLNPARVRHTQQFLKDANRRTRSIVWVNPMPESRWAETTAEAVATESGVAFLPLSDASMLRAIDILRGAKRR